MLKILVVDDEPARYSFFDSCVVGSIAEEKDIHVCSNQKSALEKLAQENYDMLVVDMAIPATAWSAEVKSTGGLELLRHIQEDDSLRRPPFIIGLTASADKEPEVEDFFSKAPWILMHIGASGVDWQNRLTDALSHALLAKGTETQIGYEIDICIVTALAEPEQSALLATDISWNTDPEYIDSNTLIRRGSLKEKGGSSLTIVAGCSLRMGNVEAALLSAKLINRFRPRLLAMAGICAGLEEKTNFGDPILGTPVWDWTSSKWELDSKGRNAIRPSPDNIECCREILSRFELLSRDRNFLDGIRNNWPAAKPSSVLNARYGPVASGPIVVADGETLKRIKNTQNRDVLGLEMEAYGVYSAARFAGHPRPLAFSIKSVCDFADPRKSDGMQNYAAYTSAAVLREFLFRFARELCNQVDK
jgi:nucleoside phosphorylase